MKRSLFRAIIKKYARLLIAMLLVSSLGCGLMAGMAGGFLSLQSTLDDYIEGMKYPDAVVDTNVLERDVLEKVSAVPGVEAADARLAGNLILVGKDGVYYSMQAMTYSTAEFQGTYIWEKSGKEAEYPILLERRFALLNDIHAGDPVEIRVGDRSWNCMVEAVISRPEMLAPHKLRDMELFGTDLGYVYVPSVLLEKVTNPDYEKASAEWDENNEKLKSEKENANEEYSKIIEELSDAERQLKEKKNELDKQLKTAESNREELLRNREELISKANELKEKEAELKEKKGELDKAEEELQKGKEELESGKEELAEKKRELDQTKEGLEEKLSALQSQLEEAEAKEKELKQTKQEVQNGIKELESRSKELDETEQQLNEAKKDLPEGLEQLRKAKEAAAALKEYAASAESFLSMSEEEQDPEKWAHEAADRLDSIIADTEELIKLLESVDTEKLDISKLAEKYKDLIEIPEGVDLSGYDPGEVITGLRSLEEQLRSYRDQLKSLLDSGTDPLVLDILRMTVVHEGRSALEKYKNEYKAGEEELNALIGKLDTAIKQAEDALAKIADGEKQIAEGRKLIEEKRKEAEDGLAQIADGEKQISEGKAALADGISQIEDGLKQAEAGYEEIAGYEKQIAEEESKLSSGQTEFDEYYEQYIESEKALAEAKETLLSADSELEAGIQTIDGKVAEGTQQFKEGENELRRSWNEAEEKRFEAQRQFTDAQEELERAKEELDKWNGYDEYCNQFLLRFEPGADLHSMLDKVKDVLGDDVLDSYTYEESSVKHSIDVNVDPLGVMALYVPMIFFAIALIVQFLFMSFLIRQCRREIGILRALGFSKNRIIALFCGVNALVSLGAVLLGLLMGHAVTKYICIVFQDYFNLFFFDFKIHWLRVLLSVGATFAVGLTATILSAGHISRVRPSEAMSRPVPAAVFSDKSRLLSRLNAPPFFKYCISTLLRNKKRLLFSIVCLSSSVVLIFAGYSFDLSKNRVLSEQFDDRIHYDCEIFMDSEPDAAFMERLSASGLVRDTETVSYFSKTIRNGEAVKEKTVKAIKPDTELIGICDSSRNRITVSGEGILLEKHTADPLNISVGDTVLVGGRSMQVTGIAEENENRYQYISADAAELLGKPDMYSVICRVDEENDVPLMEFMSGEEHYIYAMFTSRIYDGVEGGFRTFTICALIVLAFAVMIGSIVVINTICTNLQEQKKDICVLRTLGFQYSGLSFRLMIQAAVYYIFSCLIGIPCGIAVTKEVLKKMEIDARSYPFVNDYRVYTFTLLFVLVFIAVSHFISMRMIKKWDLVETVKDKE